MLLQYDNITDTYFVLPMQHVNPSIVKLSPSRMTSLAVVLHLKAMSNTHKRAPTRFPWTYVVEFKCDYVSGIVKMLGSSYLNLARVGTYPYPYTDTLNTVHHWL